MADTTVLDVAAASQFQEATGSYESIVWLSKTTAYKFSIDSTAATLRLVYQKTTTGPTGFGAAVQAGSVDSVRRFAIWYDRWTEGDSGTLIHFAWVEGINHDVRYRNLDTATDTLSTAVRVFDGTSVDAAAQLSQGACAIEKVASNLLVVHARLDNDGEKVDRYSTDGGSTWNTHAATVFASNTSSVHCIGAFDATTYAVLHLDRATGIMTLKSMTTAALVGTSATLATITVDDGYHAMSGSKDAATGDFCINYITSQSTAGATFGAIRITEAGTVTHMTNVKSSVEMSQNVSTFIDQNTGRWYVAYTSGTASGSVIAMYAYSDDGGTTWTVDQAYGETTDTLAGISAGYCCPQGSEGRFAPSFYNRDLFDVLINTGLEIDVVPAGIVVLRRRRND